MIRVPERFRDLPARTSQEGVTHTTRTDVPLWRIRVHFTTGIQPCTETRRAATAEQALQFALNSYSYADPARTVVLGKVDQTIPTTGAADVTTDLNALEPCERDERGRAMVPDDALQQAWDLHQAGHSWQVIADRLECHKDHLRKAAARLVQGGRSSRSAKPAPKAKEPPAAVGIPAIAWSADAGILVTTKPAETLAAAGWTHYLPLQQL